MEKLRSILACAIYIDEVRPFFFQCTPLFLAVLKNHEELVRYLVESGATLDPNYQGVSFYFYQWLLYHYKEEKERVAAFGKRKIV